MSTQEIIEHFGLAPHPEGGYYKETYRDTATVQCADGRIRSASTAILFLLTAGQRSHFHRIQSDELWFYHCGAPLEIWSIDPEANIAVTRLGGDGQQLQAHVPAITWFGAQISDDQPYTLVSCTVAPGFEFADFELADREVLLEAYPHLREAIERFTSNP